MYSQSDAFTAERIYSRTYLQMRAYHFQLY